MKNKHFAQGGGGACLVGSSWVTTGTMQWRGARYDRNAPRLVCPDGGNTHWVREGRGGKTRLLMLMIKAANESPGAVERREARLQILGAVYIGAHRS